MSAAQKHNSDIRARLGLRPVINVSGTMTALGASIIGPEAVEAMSAIATEWVEMDDLQAKSSKVIARLTGGEAGFVTACCAAGITMAVAGAITGTDMLAMELLPDETGDKPNEVILQLGHSVNYGAPVDQSIRLAGGKVVLAGTVSSTYDYHIANAIGPKTAAVLFVVSHHTVQYGQLSLEEVVAIAKPRGIPVIVDAASEYDLKGFLAKGADLVIYSGHKFLSGPTSGIVAGRKDLVRAAYLQNRGVARAMKVGKESVAGVMAALEAWERRDHAGIRAREQRALDLWLPEVNRHPGLEAKIIPDPTHNPLDRLEIRVHPESGFSATGLARAMSRATPPVIVRNHETELGLFYFDPCNLHPGEEETVARVLAEVMAAPRPVDAMVSPKKSLVARLNWPD